jgi:pimeloyl-ACP methyl ester carboxylesterase
MQPAEFERLAATATRCDVRASTGAVVAARMFGDPATPAVVLLHGGAGSWNHWALTIPDLSARFRLIVLDLPGCGDSTLPDGIEDGAVLDVGALDLLAASVADAVDHLVPAPARFALVGFSFGAMVGVRATAARLAPRVALVALIGSGGLGVRSEHDQPPLRAVARDADAHQRAEAHRHNLRALMLADASRADDLAVRLHAANVSRSRFRMGEVPSSRAVVEVLGLIPAPLLWITGERDIFAAGVQDRREQVVRAARPDAELLEVPEAGHWAAYERPDVVNPALLDRLAGALGGVSS